MIKPILYVCLNQVLPSYNDAYPSQIQGANPEALDVLQSHRQSWQGDVRDRMASFLCSDQPNVAMRIRADRHQNIGIVLA